MSSVAARHPKLANLFDALLRQLRQSHVASGVPVERCPSPTHFFETYYFANRPVVIKGLMDRWRALRLWSPQYFAENFGSVMVDVTADRESDARYDEHFTRHQTRMMMRDFVNRIMSRETNDLYLVGRNRLLERSEFAPLLAHFSYPRGIIKSWDTEEVPQFWMGPKGTVTPLHHDASNLLFGQLYGRKRVQLIPPYRSRISTTSALVTVTSISPVSISKRFHACVMYW